ncbi:MULTISPECIES: restriction endonuclease [unclassified Bradyrhizobium]|uniref:restriction endonuclease n=1 Tax=unclassified Bradyrhizobium TaxID=2631580 RepID=UPI001FF8C834|nr:MULTISPECIES: restriction endonuclease [unclassified Bradyrhizobium]MCK1297422.1 restriction endonuclease [Bradyrhizobium sp. 37]MCK1774189.1 restriction endonuclease [Bradyrhizobium sp. 134]
MADYDFHQLSPDDLEILARDLLQAHWGVTIESFKSGKDGGIDLRYAVGTGKIIVQVKHFVRTGLAGLMRELSKEAAKVRRLKPTRYVLVTSVPLSAVNKDAIVALIGADLLTPSDVIGQEGLNNLLGQHPEIEGKHYKLWLASRAVLDRVLHNAAVTRSEFKARQVHDEARRYVQSGAYPQAQKMINEQRVVVVAGPPGVGKTTLANLLLYEHLARGFQAVVIQRDIEEGLSLFQPGTPQIFYFDDFMGSTFLGDRSSALTSTSDKALLEFIAMVRSTQTARMVLTTREHIYSLAMDKSERLRHSDIDDLRVYLRMPDYSFAQKARILYNHLYFSDLPEEYQDELLRDDCYLRIIKHEKFNPRLIEWLSSFRRIRSVAVRDYQTFIDNLLRDPSEIWRHAYEQEVTDAGRSMLLVLFSMGGKAAGVALKPAFIKLHEHRAKRYGFATRPEDFKSALREIAGTFIKPFGTHGVEVIDPSVLDLLNAIVRRTPENAIDVVAAAHNFDQIEHVWTFAKAQSSGAVLEAFRHNDGPIAASLAQRMTEGRRIDMGKGAVGYRGPTFERRLTVVIDMADRLGSSSIASLIAPLFARLQQEWITERPDINDGVDALRALDGARSVDPVTLDAMTAAIKAALLEDVQDGCRSDELRELIGVIDTSDADADAALSPARAAFDAYCAGTFQDELRECRSREQFDGLVEDLELFRDQLGVDVSSLLTRVEEAKGEFEEHEDAYADHMQDEYKERWRDERASERSVSDMFGSLREDRS